jgi:hypothetical protein
MPKKQYISKAKSVGSRSVRKVPKGPRNPTWWSKWTMAKRISKKVATDRGNGWNNVPPRSRMYSVDKGYQGSERKLGIAATNTTVRKVEGRARQATLAAGVAAQ